jgi:hypothetical protein
MQQISVEKLFETIGRLTVENQMLHGSFQAMAAENKRLQEEVDKAIETRGQK